MITITKERLEPVIERLEHYATNVKWTNVQAAQDMLTAADAMRRLLASIEAEPVAFRSKLKPPYAGSERWDYTDHRQPDAFELENCFIERLYTAPPATVSVPDEMTMQEALSAIDQLSWQECTRDAYMLGWNACRAAMLQGADNEQQRKASIHDALCKKYNVESLADFVDWQRNHIAELEAAPPGPVGQDETAVMPDYPGYALTQRECYQAGKKAGLAEAATTTCKLPFDQWLSQQTGTIDVECGCVMTEVFFHWLRVAYEAGNSPVIPDGWVACSERLPEDEQEVLTRNKIGHCFVSFFDEHSGLFFDRIDVAAACCIEHILVTHWMPLPAAPQQEAE